MNFGDINKFINNISVIECDSKFINNMDRILKLFNEFGIVYYGHLYGFIENKEFVNDVMVYSKDKAILRLKKISDKLKIKIDHINIICVASFGEELEEKFLITEFKEKKNHLEIYSIQRRFFSLIKFSNND
jgi:hypothetical protein